jgi:hypothetical protein
MLRERRMFEDREPSIFPHPASAWWIPVLLAVGWAPLYLVDFIHNGELRKGFAMLWGVGITIPCSELTVISVTIQAFRLLSYFWSRPEKPPK